MHDELGLFPRVGTEHGIFRAIELPCRWPGFDASGRGNDLPMNTGEAERPLDSDAAVTVVIALPDDASAAADRCRVPSWS